MPGTGGDAVLVQTGDMIDKGPHSVDVVRLLIALHESARRSGGQIIVTMGNHEAKFPGGPNEDKANDFIKDLKRRHVDEGEILHCRGDIGELRPALSGNSARPGHTSQTDPAAETVDAAGRAARAFKTRYRTSRALPELSLPRDALRSLADKSLTFLFALFAPGEV